MRMEAVARQGAISLAEFTALADRVYDPERPETAWDLREPMAALTVDPSWIFPMIAEQQKLRMNSAWSREQPSYFVLHTGRNYALRANIWLPERNSGSLQVLENAAFSYDFPHDHNFDILTATCIGPGYDTDIYCYDSVPSDAGVGDVVPVEPLGRHRLAPGTVFLYQTCRDVHTQLPVDDVTVTLNFLPIRRENYARPQLIFDCVDPRNLRIIGLPLSPEGRQMSALRMLGKLADQRPQLGSGIARVAAAHANPRVAAYAGRLLDRLSDADRAQRDLLLEIDTHNVAFKYHEVAEIARATR